MFASITLYFEINLDIKDTGRQTYLREPKNHTWISKRPLAVRLLSCGDLDGVQLGVSALLLV